jgi:hypothetical protein
MLAHTTALPALSQWTSRSLKHKTAIFVHGCGGSTQVVAPAISGCKVAVRQHRRARQLHEAALKKPGHPRPPSATLGQRQRDLAGEFLADGLLRAAGLRNVPL